MVWKNGGKIDPGKGWAAPDFSPAGGTSGSCPAGKEAESVRGAKSGLSGVSTVAHWCQRVWWQVVLGVGEASPLLRDGDSSLCCAPFRMTALQPGNDTSSGNVDWRSLLIVAWLPRPVATLSFSCKEIKMLNKALIGLSGLIAIGLLLSFAMPLVPSNTYSNSSRC